MSRKILITGSGGFIGKNLKEFFKPCHEILCPRSFELNLLDAQAVKRYFKSNDIDFIIHCSNVGGVRGVADGDTTVEDNLSMVDNLLMNKKNNAGMIVFGSGAMYDKSRALNKVKECEIGEYVPLDLYGKSKLLLSQKIKDRDDVLCLNIFGCYGKYEKESRFPTYSITQNINKQPITINQNVVFDYLYIDDLCRIINHFIENNWKNNIINVTPTKSISLLEIAEIVNGISDVKSEIVVSNSVMNNPYTGSNELLLTEINNFEFTSYEAGLTALYKIIAQSKK